MKKFILILLVLVSFPVYCIETSEYQTKFNDANNLYQSGNYENALKIYEEIVNSGANNFETFFNLGNTYYRLNKIPDAIYYYEKARKLQPGDEDVNFNIRIANLKTVDKIDEKETIFFVAWFDTIIETMSSVGWSKFFIIFQWLAVALFVIYLFTKSLFLQKYSFFGFLTVLAVSIVFLLFSYIQYDKETNTRNAIIFTPNVYVKNAPDPTSTDLFILHEGTKIEIMDAVNDWYKIKLSNGDIGWMLKSTLKEI